MNISVKEKNKYVFKDIPLGDIFAIDVGSSGKNELFVKIKAGKTTGSGLVNAVSLRSGEMHYIPDERQRKRAESIEVILK